MRVSILGRITILTAPHNLIEWFPASWGVLSLKQGGQRLGNQITDSILEDAIQLIRYLILCKVFFFFFSSNDTCSITKLILRFEIERICRGLENWSAARTEGLLLRVEDSIQVLISFPSGCKSRLIYSNSLSASRPFTPPRQVVSVSSVSFISIMATVEHILRTRPDQ